MRSIKFLVILGVLLALVPMTAFGAYRHSPGAVYAMTNAPDGNQIVAYERSFDGRLTLMDTYDTGGLGSGGSIDPLGSQGSLILSRNHRWLIGVDAGSNDIFVFRVRPHGLDPVGNFDSGGDFPVSVTLYHNILYVLNADRTGAAPNITGFTLNHWGELTPLDGSTRPLGTADFHQVGFNPRGDALVVTEGNPTGNNAIHVFGIDEDGLPDATATVSPSEGVVPFGFVFDWRGHLLVSEAGSGAVSSYDIRDDKTLEVISSSVPNNNRATCWIAINWLGSVFTANTGSNNLSGYKVRFGSGEVQLKDAQAATGNKPIDMAVSAGGFYLYVLNAGDGTVGAFRISPFGFLEDLGTVAGLPLLYAQGIAAR